MITIHDKALCCGCAACVQICPKQCIEFEEDNQGFRYPSINTSICINCGLCELVCPILNQNNKASLPIRVYASKNRSEEIRSSSSSGGVFTALAERVLRQGGVVFGARFDSNWEVEHDFVCGSQNISIFRGSKYMQSRIGATYVQAERFLKDGRKVLYSGTPCQIAGLNHYLRKDYNNLITVDVICHGVPSPLVWRHYLKNVTEGQRVTDVVFRNKVHSWKKYNFSIKGDDGALIDQPFYENLYMRGFLDDIYLRPSCYECVCKCGKSGADITLGDFWGIERHLPEFDDDKGVTAVLAHTVKAVDCLETLDLDSHEISYEKVLEGNPSLEKSARNNAEWRREYWGREDQVEAISYILKKKTPNLFKRIVTKLSRMLRN